MVSDFSPFQNAPTPTRTCFANQVLFFGLLGNAEELAFYRNSADFKNARSCLARTKETKMDAADLRPRKVMCVFNNFNFTYNTTALSRAGRN